MKTISHTARLFFYVLYTARTKSKHVRLPFLRTYSIRIWCINYTQLRIACQARAGSVRAHSHRADFCISCMCSCISIFEGCLVSLTTWTGVLLLQLCRASLFSEALVRIACHHREEWKQKHRYDEPGYLQRRKTFWKLKFTAFSLSCPMVFMVYSRLQSSLHTVSFSVKSLPSLLARFCILPYVAVAGPAGPEVEDFPWLVIDAARAFQSSKMWERKRRTLRPIYMIRAPYILWICAKNDADRIFQMLQNKYREDRVKKQINSLRKFKWKTGREETHHTLCAKISERRGMFASNSTKTINLHVKSVFS